MSFQVAQIGSLLMPELIEWWDSGASRHEAVTCVTCVGTVEEIQSCRAGEVVVLADGEWEESALRETVAQLAARRAGALLIPESAVAGSNRADLRDVAQRHGFPVGLLRDDVNLLRAANSIGRAAVAARSEIRPLSGTAETLQALADSLGRLVGNSVTIESPQHELLAFSAMENPVDRVREETILRRRGQTEALKWVISQGYVSKVRSSEVPISVPGNPELDFSGRVAMRVAAEGEILAIIWVAENHRPLADEDRANIEHAAETAATILLQQRAAAQKEAELRTDFLEDIVTGRITGLESIRTLARSFGWQIDHLHQSLVVTIDDLEAVRLRHASQGSARLQRIRERLTEIVHLEAMTVDADAIVAPRSSGVIVLFDSREREPDSRKRTAIGVAGNIVNRVGALLPELTVTVGAGRDFGSVGGIGDSIREGEVACRLAGALWGGNRAIHFTDLGIHRTLFALQDQEEMIPAALQRIVDHDARHQSDYLRTVDVYFSCMGRLRPAAQKLNIHRNTLEYRMQRIEQLAGIKLDEPNNRLAMELGIRLLELKRRTAGAATSFGTNQSD